MSTSLSGWERVARAIEEVRERLLRCTAALEAAGVAYAVAGGNAVAESLVLRKLTAFRRKDQVHLLDLLQVKLIDASWIARLPAPLAARLQELIDNPE